jgi:hypothetical protein
MREAVCFSILKVGSHDSFLYTWPSKIGALPWIIWPKIETEHHKRHKYFNNLTSMEKYIVGQETRCARLNYMLDLGCLLHSSCIRNVVDKTSKNSWNADLLLFNFILEMYAGLPLRESSFLESITLLVVLLDTNGKKYYHNILSSWWYKLRLLWFVQQQCAGNVQGVWCELPMYFYVFGIWGFTEYCDFY